ncbi:MAG: DsbA family protein [Bacteroidetes bacterium]|nr:DsbA family protein [Bacteroidota bacterium]
MPKSGAKFQQNAGKRKPSRADSPTHQPSGDTHNKGGKPTASPARRSITSLVAIASAVGVLLAVVGVGLNLLSVGMTSRPTAAVAATPDTNKSDPFSKGSTNAPVVVDEWFDFQCPACRAYYLTRQPEFDKQFVDTGKVRFVTHFFPFLGPESYLAAEAAEAAAAQGYYWAYENILFQRQGAENSGAFSVENLKQFAAELGLNQQAFNAALDQRTYQAAVLKQKSQGEALGVNATPTFFVDGQKVQGVPSLDAWQQIINQELSKKP